MDYISRTRWKFRAQNSFTKYDS